MYALRLQILVVVLNILKYQDLYHQDARNVLTWT